MALITCPECSKQISEFAENCPNCGYPTLILINEVGIINEINNPFASNRQYWIQQGCGFTKHRKTQLHPLLNISKDNILDLRPENEARYVAFIAIRWGFAKLTEDQILKATERFNNYDQYNKFGQKIYRTS